MQIAVVLVRTKRRNISLWSVNFRINTVSKSSIQPWSFWL